MKQVYSNILTTIMILCLLLNINTIQAQNQTIKQILQTYYANKPLYIGASGDWKSFGLQSMQILDSEFNYATPANDFKQPYIHPDLSTWKWVKSDAWISHCATTNQILRLHAPISPQCSDWVADDSRTAAELTQMEQEYLTGLYQQYANEPCVRWFDVINETIASLNVTDPMGNVVEGGWFGPRTGTTLWENPWPIIGIDNTTTLKVPLYIDKAFQLADQYAPNKKHIINQCGDFEVVVWDKMKLLVSYLRSKGRKVDGVGWQAHVDLGWEKVPGNLTRLSAFVDWCHQNNLEFHITEFNVWDPTNTNQQGQADTFGSIVSLLVSKLSTGTIAINFWGIKDEDTGNPTWYGTLWDNTGTAKPAYYRVKQELLNKVTVNDNSVLMTQDAYAYVDPNGNLQVSNVPTGENISLFDVKGNLISTITSTNNQARFTLLSKGFYLIKFQSKILKIIF